MRQGQTWRAPLVVGADLTGMEIHVTFEAGAEIVKKDEDLSVTVEDGVTYIECLLTQEDTLSLDAPSICRIQVRAANGGEAIATSEGYEPVEGCIEKGVIGGD